MRQNAVKPLRILHLEDQPRDSQLAAELLRRDGLSAQIDRVDTMEAFCRSLVTGRYSLIVSDYSLPGMDALEALRYARQRHPEVPFIFLSGTLGEDRAIESLKIGATDYVLKQSNARFVPAVRRALREAQEHARRQRAERALHKHQARLHSLAKQPEEERKRVEQELVRGRAVLEAILQGCPVGIIVADQDGRVVRMNPAGARLWGLASFSDSIEHYPHWKGWWADDSERQGRRLAPDEWALDRALRGEVCPGDIVEIEPFGAPGTRRNLLNCAVPVRSPIGEILGAVVAQMDITDRIRIQASAAELKRRLNAAVIAGEIGIFEWNVPHRRLWGDANFARFYGIPLDENGAAPLSAFINVIHPDDRVQVLERINRSFETGAPYEAEYRIVAGQNTRWVSARGTAERDQSGRVLRVSGVILDVTQRKQAEALLKAALRSAELERTRLAAVLEAIPAGVAIADANGKISRFNSALSRIWGGPPFPRSTRDYREWRGRWAATGEPLTADDWAMARALRTGEVVPGDVVNIEKFDGSGTATIINAAAPIRNFDGQIVGGVVAETDITEQVRAEAALQRRNEHLQILHQAAAALLLGAQPVDLLRALHERIAQTFGADVFMLYQTHADGRLHLEACAGVSQDQRVKLETFRFGRLFCATSAEALQPVIINDIQSCDDPHYRFLRKLALTSYLYYPLVLNGRLQGTLAFASHGREDYDSTDLEFFHTIAGTISEALERRRLQLELESHAANLEREVQERTAKLRETVAELEGFSYSLVHDMRAPLRAMLSYAGILEAEAGTRLAPEETDLLRRIGTAARRMDQLVTDSLNFSMIIRQELPLRPVNLGILLRGMLDTYPNLRPPQAEVSVEFDDLFVYGNEAALIQIFSNLLGNAVKFVAPGVHPRVRVWAENHRCSRPTETSSPGVAGQSGPPGDRPVVWICVQDNGIGIPPKAHEKIFGMFQRLHRSDEYPGTGIGLALVKKALERTGGEITLESEVDHGSQFCVKLPLA